MAIQRREWMAGMGAAAWGGYLAGTPERAHAAARWRLATGYKSETFHTQNVEQFAREASAASAGALQIDVHPNNSLARLADIFEAVKSGKAEAGEVLMGGIVGQVPLAGADSVPFVVSSYQDAQRLWTHQKPLIDTAMQAHGLAALYAVPWPPQGLFSVRPLRSSAIASLTLAGFTMCASRIACLRARCRTERGEGYISGERIFR